MSYPVQLLLETWLDGRCPRGWKSSIVVRSIQKRVKLCQAQGKIRGHFRLSSRFNKVELVDKSIPYLPYCGVTPFSKYFIALLPSW